MRVFITGASGFAGPYLVAACEADGDTVITAPPSSTANLADPAVARQLIADARPEVVYHLAARAHVGQSWDDPLGTFSDNVAMTANVLEAVRRAGLGGVSYASSSAAFARADGVRVAADADGHPTTFYGVH